MESLSLRERERASEARRAIVRLAREDPNVFCAYVLRDEKTGKRIRQGAIHREWHDILDRERDAVIWAFVDAGKSAQISIGRVLWLLGRNPAARIVPVTKTAKLAKKLVRACAQYIERSPELREVFPNLKPSTDPSLPWTSTAITVERPSESPIGPKDPSIEACSVLGNVQGSRIDHLVLDDILDFENTRTAGLRDHVWEWIQGTLFGRLSGEDATTWVLTNAWHPEDAAHRFVNESGFPGYRFPVVREDGALAWPEHWPASRIERERQRMGPIEFARALLCQPRCDENALCKREWIDWALERGRGFHLLTEDFDLALDIQARGEELGYSPEEITAISAAAAIYRLTGEGHDPIRGAGVRLYTGVDLAFSKRDSADKTALVTIAVFPNGTRRVCDVRSGRWNTAEQIKNIVQIHKAFGSIFVVENVGAQQTLVDVLQGWTAIPIVPFTTGLQKAHPELGVQGLLAELAGKKWIVPSGRSGKERSPEVDLLVRGALQFAPGPHTSDHLMAMWFAREGARMYERGAPAQVQVRVFG